MGSVQPITPVPFAEFPKHVTVGKNEDGKAITKIVANAAEEKALLDSLAAVEEPAQPEEPAQQA